MPFLDFCRGVCRRLGLMRRQAPPRACFVLLLREPTELPQPVVQLAAERALNIQFDGRGGGGNHVMRMGLIAVIQLGPEMLQVFTSSKPFGKEWTSKRMPKLPSGPAWVGHRAFMCLDNLTADSMDAARFRTLGRVAAELLNTNCLAVFLPHLNEVVLNHAALAQRLREFDSWDELRVAGDPPLAEG